MDDGIPMERLEAEITTLAAHLAAAMCRWLLLVAEFDRRRGWETWECRSAAHWLSWKCGIDYRTARDHLRVGTALGPLPLVTATFERGELSYSQVRAITRIATPATEEGLVQLARHSTAAQLERVVRAASKVLDLEEVKNRHGRRALSWTHDEDGSVVLSVRMSPEDGELAKVTIDAFTENLPYDPGSAEPHAARAVDGFLDKIRAARTADVIAGDTTDRATVLLVDDQDGTRLADGTPLHPETAKRLACDSSVIAMYMRDGEPLDVDRKTPTPNRAMRRALARRDLTCRFPGCDTTRFLHAHHLHHWGHGGHTKITNLLLLCPFHHRLHHEGGYKVSIDVLGRFAFRRPDGVILTVEALHATGPDLAHRNDELGLTIDHRTCQSRWGGEHLDLSHAVDVALGTGLAPRSQPALAADLPAPPSR